MNTVFTNEQNQMLKQALDPRLISTRKGGGNTSLKYIEGHDAIDQANRIFGEGNWAYRPLSCEQTVIMDPLTGEACGISYKARVELIVRGCVAPIEEVGSQPVATWNVEDQIWKTRMSNAKYNHAPLDESEFKPFEKAKARGLVVDAHEMAEKGAVTDALKRALRTFGDQFGNGLYGDGRVAIDEPDSAPAQTAEKVVKAAPSQVAKKPAPKAAPAPKEYAEGAPDRAMKLYNLVVQKKYISGTGDQLHQAFWAFCSSIVGHAMTKYQDFTHEDVNAVLDYIKLNKPEQEQQKAS